MLLKIIEEYQTFIIKTILKIAIVIYQSVELMQYYIMNQNIFFVIFIINIKLRMNSIFSIASFLVTFFTSSKQFNIIVKWNVELRKLMSVESLLAQIRKLKYLMKEDICNAIKSSHIVVHSIYYVFYETISCSVERYTHVFKR